MFSRYDTKVIKGIAIILMLMHHLWYMPSRIADGGLISFVSLFGQSAMVYFGSFGKICVSIFFFLGGYGIYLSARGKEFDLISKLKNLYIRYWKVFLIFIPLGFIFFRNQPAYCQSSSIYARFSSFGWEKLLKNFLGVSNTLNGEWWFFSSYVIAVCSFPFFRLIAEKSNAAAGVMITIVCSILMTNVFPSLGDITGLGNLNSNHLYYAIFTPSKAAYFACFIMGIVFAKNNLLIRMQHLWEKNGLNHLGLDLIAILFIIFLRNNVYHESFDLFYVPFFIVAANDFAGHVLFLKKTFYRLGCESTNMWLCHSFFCYYFYPFVKVVVFPKWCVLSLIVLIIMSYVASLLITLFWRKIKNVSDHFIPVLLHETK